jgi:ATP-dependent exoDNAse (exonuclease V) beta subunit
MDEYKMVKEQEAQESRRLLYVGMTRARDRMVFAVRRGDTNDAVNLKTGWLDELSDDPESPLIRWPIQKGLQQADVVGEEFPVTVSEFFPTTPDPADQTAEEPAQFLPPTVENPPSWPSAHIVPSALIADPADDATHVVVEDAADFKTRIPIRGKPDFAALGNAIHGFFAAGADHLPQERQLEIAARLLNRWGVQGTVEPTDVLKAAERLSSFLASRYPGARAFREWPVSCRNEKHQRMQGWIDLLLELPEGYVIIDHKTTPNVEREHAKSYAPQLLAYREAVERATGKKVLATLLHLPVCGLVVEVREVEAREDD